MCFAARWINGHAKDTKNLMFYSEFEDGQKKMLEKAHALFDEADAILTYNGEKFDIPTLNKEFLKNGYPPPCPSKHIDLYKVAKKRFKFASNKMVHLARELGIRGKVRHEGHDLWVRCMAGDKKAWHRMQRYNKRDVIILEAVYKRLLPWITNHPNVALSGEGTMARVCPNCGSSKLQARGYSVSRVRKYRRYQGARQDTIIRPPAGFRSAAATHLRPRMGRK